MNSKVLTTATYPPELLVVTHKYAVGFTVNFNGMVQKVAAAVEGVSLHSIGLYTGFHAI